VVAGQIPNGTCLEFADNSGTTSNFQSGELARIWALPEFGQYSAAAGLFFSLNKELNRSIATAFRSFRVLKVHHRQPIFF
jgi:hypothetical protein